MQLLDYKILAFATSVKLYRRNSCIYTLENKKEFCKQIGLSYNTFKKYFEYCKQKGLFNETQGAYQFKKINEVASLLNIDIKHIEYFKWSSYEKPSVNAIYNKIVDGVVLLNFKQQQFRIDKKKKELSKVEKIQNRKKTHPAVVKSVVKKYGSVVKAKNSICRNFTPQIVSGKRHVANIVGCSNATGINILKRLVKQNLITREIKFEKLNLPYSHLGYDQAKTKKGIIVCSPKLQTLFLSLGSIICLLGQG